MIDRLLQIVPDFWAVLGEMSPYLLFGFLVAGALSVLISARTVERHLGGHGFWPVFKASMFGIPLPLCSCGVIPVAASLHRQGASKGATVGFLISTPQTGVDSILVTLSLLGPVFAIYRPVAALVSGLLGGTLVTLAAGKDGLDKPGHAAHAAAAEDEMPSGVAARVRSALAYGFGELPEDIGQSMLVGLLIAAVITALVPGDFFASVLGGGVLAMLLMMALGIPVYVCATASVPVAAALIAKGVSPGVALVFLMTGPATNAATIATVWRTMGPRTAMMYLLSVAGTALASGLTLDYVFRVTGAATHAEMGWMVPPLARDVLAVALLAVLLVGVVRSYLPVTPKRAPGAEEQAVANEPRCELKISGMTCNHCRMAVERALKDVPGADSVEVELRGGRAVVRGSADAAKLTEAVEAAGYEAKVVSDASKGQS